MQPNISHKHEALIRLLREARKERNITQEELSERLGYHRVFVTKYESGDRKLNVFELMAICRELSLDVHAVIRAVEGKTSSHMCAHEEYLHGFSKGFLVAKGYEVAGGVLADEGDIQKHVATNRKKIQKKPVALTAGGKGKNPSS